MPLSNGELAVCFLNIGTTAQNTKATIPAHGVLMVRLSKKAK